MKSFVLVGLAIAGTLCSVVPYSQAAVINQTYSGGFPGTISGTLPNQGTALEESFTLPSISNLTITTTSYATGGFETNLLLFNSMGKSINSGIPFGAPDPKTGIVGDSRLTAPNLPAGMYTLALTDFLLNQSFTATNLSDGFNDNSGSGTNFVDGNNNPRTGSFAFTINAPAPVPEPGTAWLAAPFLAVLAMRTRKGLSKQIDR
ncbi:MAG: DVUA0089 family protein [Bryobacteraceae bacterium]